MSDATREAADRLHLLRMAQLFFEFAARRLGGLAVGHLAPQFVIGARQCSGALVDASLEVAVRFVQGQLAGAQLLLGVVALGDIAQDQHDLRAGHRLQAGFEETRCRRVGANLDLEVHWRAALGQPRQRLDHGTTRRRVEHLGDRPPNRPAPGRFRMPGTLHIKDDPVAVDSEDLVRKGGHQRTQFGVGLQQFL